jgi:hypothetical protein
MRPSDGSVPAARWEVAVRPRPGRFIIDLLRLLKDAT